MMSEQNTKITKRGQLNILTWNARGLKNKCNELFKTLIEEKIDVACLQETLLTSKNRLYHQSYCIIRRDRILVDNKYNGHGLAILIKRDIKFKVHKDPPPNTKAEFIGIQILNNKNFPINIYSIYIPGNKLRYPDLDHLINSNQPVVIAGDYNAKHHSWDKYNENTNGKRLA
uniref:Endonuclease/exonuclease/phosphatase domain-containing protein n=1 Tax=Cacopsylla melanoneura TaxID=428564 RepID=A0A8D8W3I7_9HEMI